MPTTPILATLIRKGDIRSNVPATLAATPEGYTLDGLPVGLLEGGELLAVVVHLVENEAGYLPPDTKEGNDGKRS